MLESLVNKQSLWNDNVRVSVQKQTQACLFHKHAYSTYRFLQNSTYYTQVKGAKIMEESLKSTTFCQVMENSFALLLLHKGYGSHDLCLWCGRCKHKCFLFTTKLPPQMYMQLTTGLKLHINYLICHSLVNKLS